MSSTHVSNIEREPDPRGIVEAADLVAREGAHQVEETHVTSMLESHVRPRTNEGEEWQEARDALLAALAAIRREQ